MFTLSSYPRAIVHIDADAFFVTCEQALHPELKGKKVVCGQERGIAAAMSYEAKAAGVTRGMRFSDIKKLCPDVIFLPSDYETYSLFSKRMFEIIRRFSGLVEEYSIDEAFIDITGLQRPQRMSYKQIAETMQQTIVRELGISVSVGLAPTKVLAKVASSFRKPMGLVCIPGKKAHEFLRALSVGNVWGIGPQTTSHCRQLGIVTALDFANKHTEWIAKNFTKPHQEIHRELRGELVYDICAEEKTRYVSISKTKTFTPISSDRAYVWAQLVTNIENACIKARRHSLSAREMVIFLKTQSFNTEGKKIKLSRVSNIPHELLLIAQGLFDTVFEEGVDYRATGVVLTDLTEQNSVQMDMFESRMKTEHMQNLYEAVDNLSKKYGKHTVHTTASLSAHTNTQHHGARDTSSQRIRELLQGETKRQHVGIPYIA